MDKIGRIKRLRVYEKNVNHWKGKEYKPYTVRLVELDKVLKIVSEEESIRQTLIRTVWRKLTGR